jgi:hypothetical protein
MAYEVPGHVERISPELTDLWNGEIIRAYEARAKLHTRFFVLNPDDLKGSQVTDGVTWPADPLGPSFCADTGTMQALCDWGNRGRQAFHNEYCEYAVVYRQDGNGRTRPKRVQVTTELREYWLTLATHDPEQLRSAAADVLDMEPAWEELYGVPDPARLAKAERRLRFAATMAGHGEEPDLKEAGVPRDPAGVLNTENAVFMSHPINGLNDLLFIVLFGARHFAVREPGGELRRAERNDVLAKQRALACRHGDPAAVLAAYEAVLGGRAIGFANPLGMYLRPFNHRVLELAGQPIPQAWVRWNRGEAGMFQRLELGPADDDDAFLDDIEFNVGQERQRLRGGYQLLRMLEVGPLLATGVTRPASEEEFERVATGGPIECSDDGACKEVSRLKGEYALAGQPKTPPWAGA